MRKPAKFKNWNLSFRDSLIQQLSDEFQNRCIRHSEEESALQNELTMLRSSNGENTNIYMNFVIRTVYSPQIMDMCALPKADTVISKNVVDCNNPQVQENFNLENKRQL